VLGVFGVVGFYTSRLVALNYMSWK